MVLNSDGVEGLMWTLTAVAILLSFGRYWIRYTYVSALEVSDGFHFVALLLLIAISIQYTAGFPNLNKISFPDPNNPPTGADLNLYQHLAVSASCIWFIAIYCVKFSFLFFYRTVFGVSKKFMRVWWVVLVFTILSLAASLAMELTTCGGKTKNLFNPVACNAPSNKLFLIQGEEVFCVLNILSDVAVMALPLWMLRRLQMPIGQKIGLGALFSLATIGIIFDIVRTVYSIRAEAASFFYIAVLFDIIEIEIAVIISTLIAYRKLFGQHEKRSTSYRNLLYTRNTTRNQTIASSQHSQAGGDFDVTHLDNMSKVKLSSSSGGRSAPDVAPLEAAHVV